METAQNPLPPVPTTKILAISHFRGSPMTATQRAQIMPHEVHDTVSRMIGKRVLRSVRFDESVRGSLD